MTDMYIFWYFLVAVGLWPVIYRLFYKFHQKHVRTEWEDADRIFMVLWGGMVCLLWFVCVPLLIIMLLGWYLVKHSRGFFELLEKD